MEVAVADDGAPLAGLAGNEAFQRVVEVFAPGAGDRGSEVRPLLVEGEGASGITRSTTSPGMPAGVPVRRSRQHRGPAPAGQRARVAQKFDIRPEEAKRLHDLSVIYRHCIYRNSSPTWCPTGSTTCWRPVSSSPADPAATAYPARRCCCSRLRELLSVEKR
jgi:hypothetical protein